MLFFVSPSRPGLIEAAPKHILRLDGRIACLASQLDHRIWHECFCGNETPCRVYAVFVFHGGENSELRFQRFYAAQNFAQNRRPRPVPPLLVEVMLFWGSPLPPLLHVQFVLCWVCLETEDLKR